MQQTIIAPSFWQGVIGLIIAVPLLVYLAWHLWVSYVQTLFIGSIKWTLLEVKPPKEVFKSPLAMELVLNSLYQTGGHGNWLQKYWQGAVRNWFALEIVSIEGSIHFYIRTATKFKAIIQSQIYAQYPQAEVSEVEDYTTSVPDFTTGSIGLWGTQFVFAKDEAYPIKTYIDFGLDRAVGSLDEEQRIDPITPMLEFMGSIGTGEQIWFQIMVRAVTDRFTIKGKDGEESGKKWPDKIKSVIKEFNDSLNEKDKEGKTIATRRATRGEQGVIEAIERNGSKFAFDSGIRAVYVTQKDKFDANRIAGLTGMVRQYSSNDFNSFKPEGPTAFDFPWEDLTGSKIIKKKQGILDAYKARAYFYGAFDLIKPQKYVTYPEKSGKAAFVLSTEELATMFHLPGRVAETPSFTRIEATKAEPPANLPV
ncbi:MAG: hypothetical protein JWL92_231 [Candidatus Nomurabacteria bacterium]|nr:hypothetical protein [Candidatus Nomurabacteria bacterium]